MVFFNLKKKPKTLRQHDCRKTKPQNSVFNSSVTWRNLTTFAKFLTQTTNWFYGDGIKIKLSEPSHLKQWLVMKHCGSPGFKEAELPCPESTVGDKRAVVHVTTRVLWSCL